MNTDHVVLREEGVLLCRHCGAQYKLNMPCPVAVFAAACAAYSQLHATCPAPATTTNNE